MSDAPADTAPATGCTLCNHRITGPGLPSFCGDFATAYSPGRLIKPSEIAAAPSWCPKMADAA